MTSLDELIRERDQALLSLDAHEIKRFMNRWNIRIPEDDREFWKIVRNALVEIGAPHKTIRSAEIRMQYASRENAKG